MGRHRIEIEFTASAANAEELYAWVGTNVAFATRIGLINGDTDFEMTPVIARCTGGGGTGCLCNVCSPS